MNNQLKSKYEYKKTVPTLFALTLLFGLLTALFDLIAFPFLVAMFAALFVFSSSNPRGLIFVCVAAALTVTVGFLSSPMAAFAAIASLVCGLVAGLTFLLSRSKPESVTVTLVTFLAMIAAALWILAAVNGEGASFTHVREFYMNGYEDLRWQIIIEAEKNYSAMGNLSPEDISGMMALLPVYLDNIAYLAPSVVAIFAFILVGISYKIFIRLLYKYSILGAGVLRWRFTTTNVFVAFYVVLALLNIFVSDSSAFSLSVLNLYTFFSFLYAYIGYNFVLALISQRMRYGVAVLLMWAAIILFSSFAVTLLSLGGVVFTFISNKTGGFGTLPRIGHDEKKTDNESENDNEKD